MRSVAPYVFTIATATVVAHAQTPVLDLTQPPIDAPPTPGKLVSPGIEEGPIDGVRGGIYEGQADRPNDFEATLLGITPASCFWQDRVFYEIELRNTSSSSLLVPWSTAESDATTSDGTPETGYRKLSMNLVIEAPNKRPPDGTMLNIISLAYGSAAVSGSLKAIVPGDKVRLRAAAQCSNLATSELETLKQTLPNTFSVRACVTLWAAPNRPGFTIVSNPTPLHIAFK